MAYDLPLLMGVRITARTAVRATKRRSWAAASLGVRFARIASRLSRVGTLRLRSLCAGDLGMDPAVPPTP